MPVVGSIKVQHDRNNITSNDSAKNHNVVMNDNVSYTILWQYIILLFCMFIRNEELCNIYELFNWDCSVGSKIFEFKNLIGWLK